MKLADVDGDGHVTLLEYERSIIRALKKQGIKIYEEWVFLGLFSFILFYWAKFDIIVWIYLNLVIIFTSLHTRTHGE